MITANKVAFALHWHELQKAAKKSGAGLYYEAAVCAAIPIIHSLEESLQANRIIQADGDCQRNDQLYPIPDEQRKRGL